MARMSELMPEEPLVAHSHVTPWGFVVALVPAIALVLVGGRALQERMLPRRLGVFVEPPEWLVGALLLAFAMFLFLVGVAEFARYVKPATEVVIDRAGIATYGLMGERRVAWGDVLTAERTPFGLALTLRGKGHLPPPDVRIHFDRLDAEPNAILRKVRLYRPDLFPADA